MMIIVNRIEDSISGSVNGKPFGVSFSEEKYAAMKELEQAANEAKTMEELQEIVEEFTPMTTESYKELVEHSKGGQFLSVNPHTGKVYLTIKGKTSSKALPKAFVDRIITSVEKKIDVMPLVKCWARFLRNPFYSDTKAARFANYLNTTFTNNALVEELMDKHGLSFEVATARATTYDVSITQEGLLNTYKVSTEITTKFVKDEDAEDGVKQVDRYDFEVDEFTGLKTYNEPQYVEERVFEPAVQGKSGDEFYCGAVKGHIIRVGQVHYLDSWDKVNTNDSLSCVPGLHVGGLRYIRSYQHPGTVTHNVFVSPEDIGAITNDGSGALRVRRYFVHSSFAGVNKGIYHSSTLAKITDLEYEELIEEAINVAKEKTKAIAEEMNEKHHLLDLN